VKLGAFLASWRGTQLENRISRFVIILLAVAIVYQARQVSLIERTVVLVPPDITETVEIARGHASREAQEAWALHVAQLLGNVTPETAPYLADLLGPLLGGNIRDDVLQVLEEQVQEITRERLEMRFHPREIAYEETHGRVYITGNHVTRGPGVERAHEQIRTYEVRVDHRQYRPLITFLDVYPGVPKLPSAREKEVQANANASR
jgi:conjugal transfer pilus assembly protein TraE